MRSVEVVRVVSGMVVIGFSLFLFGLAGVSAARPSRAERFLRSFASSARAHYTEQALRLLVGAALITFASSMWHPQLFRLFGWLIAVTSMGLLLIPWRWHHKFAQRVMPPVLRHIRLLAFGASALGAFVLYGVSRCALS